VSIIKDPKSNKMDGGSNQKLIFFKRGKAMSTLFKK
jgi:hypothetical protein